MSSEGQEHDSNCHHCHITAPIPLGELLKTHPLRLRDGGTSKSGVRAPETGPSRIEILKLGPFNTKNENLISKNSLTKTEFSKENSPDSLKTLIHDDDSSISNSSSDSVEEDLTSSEADPPPPPSENSDTTSEVLPKYSGTFSKRFALIRPATSFLHKFTKSTLYRRNFLSPKLSSSSTTNLHSESTRNTSLENIFSDDNFVPPPKIFVPISDEDVATSSDTNRFNSIYQTLSRYDVKGSKLKFKDGETQTSVPRSFLRNNVSLTSSTGSQVNFLQRKKTKRKQKKTPCSLPCGLLIAGYLLLLVIAIVVAVALGQRARRPQSQAASPLPRRPTSFPGAAVSPSATPSRRIVRPQQQASEVQGQGRIAIRRPVKRTRIATRGGQGGRRRVRPSNRNQFQAVQPVVNVFTTTPPPPPPAPVQPFPQPRPSPAIPTFQDEDFDYFSSFDDASFILPNEIPQQTVESSVPFPAAPSNPPRRFPTQAPSPAQEVRTIARAPAQAVVRKTVPRRGLNTNFKQEFNNLSPQQTQGSKTDVPRGQRQPAVQIVKSWSNRNGDGTFSWGYINTDGTFKNETKGTDCVVRGVYGYIDQDTGETMTFPYEAGNPCDPNAPEYFYDYDAGTLNVGGQVVRRKNNAAANVLNANRRLPVQ